MFKHSLNFFVIASLCSSLSFGQEGFLISHSDLRGDEVWHAQLLEGIYYHNRSYVRQRIKASSVADLNLDWQNINAPGYYSGNAVRAAADVYEPDLLKELVSIKGVDPNKPFIEKHRKLMEKFHPLLESASYLMNAYDGRTYKLSFGKPTGLGTDRKWLQFQVNDQYPVYELAETDIKKAPEIAQSMAKGEIFYLTTESSYPLDEGTTAIDLLDRRIAWMKEKLAAWDFGVTAIEKKELCSFSRANIEFYRNQLDRFAKMYRPGANPTPMYISAHPRGAKILDALANDLSHEAKLDESQFSFGSVEIIIDLSDCKKIFVERIAHVEGTLAWLLANGGKRMGPGKSWFVKLLKEYPYTSAKLAGGKVVLIDLVSKLPGAGGGGGGKKNGQSIDDFDF